MPSASVKVRATLIADHRNIVFAKSSLDVGEAFMLFVRELRGGEVSIIGKKMHPDRISTREPLAVPGDARIVMRYEAEAETLRPLREALWYYTRHPNRRNLLDTEAGRRLEEQCAPLYPKMRQHAQSHISIIPDADLQQYWKLSVLFAAGVRAKRIVLRAARLPAERFEDLLGLWIGDPNPGISFEEMLSTASPPAS